MSSARENVADRIGIVLTPMMSGPLPVAALNVQLDIPFAQPQPLVLELDTLRPGLLREQDQVTDLAVSDRNGPVSMIGVVATNDGDGFQRWRSARPIVGAAKVSYEMPAALQNPSKRGPHEDLQVAGGGLSGSFAGFLALPAGQQTLNADISWHIPVGQAAVSTRGVGDFHWVGTPDALRETLFLVGPVAQWPKTAPLKGFSITALGVADDKLAAAASWPMRTYEAEREALGQPATAYRLLIRSYDGGPVFSGRAEDGGYLLYLPPGSDPTAASLHATMAHEMVHSLVGYLDGEPGETGNWFTEGIADYLSLILPWKAGLYSNNEYLRLVNEEAAEYYTNPNRSLPNAEAASRMYSGRNTWSTLYTRGALYFADLDAKLSERRRKGVVDLVRALITRIHAGSPAADSTWEAVLREQAGPWALKDWREMMAGALIRPGPGAFSRCFFGDPIDTGLFSLGFGGSGHLVKGTIIVDLDPGSNAAKAGLQTGDVLTAGVDLNEYANRYARPITLRFTRDGVAGKVTFDPHSGRTAAMRWRVDRKCGSSKPSRRMDLI